MKRNILISLIIIFVSIFNLRAYEKPKYLVTKDSYFVDYYYDHYENTQKIKKGTILNLRDNWSFLISDTVNISIHGSSTYGKIFPEIAIPLRTDTLFDEDFLCTNTKESFLWLPVYYLDFLKSKQRDYLLKNDEKDVLIEVYDGEHWIDYFLLENYLKVTNIMIGLGIVNDETEHRTYDLNIIDIKKVNHGYDVTVTNGRRIINTMSEIYDIDNWLFSVMPNYTDYTPYKLLIRFDGDYLNLFLNNLNTPIQTFFKAYTETQEQIRSLVKINTVDLSRVTWPRHADGTCDYDGSKKAHTATKPAAISSTPTINVAPNKTMTVKENLKLRSGEAATTSVLAVMSAGTRVKILTLGRQATIDGITSNWVQVEVQAGAKDKDGKAIAAGTTGWCFGGYLTER